MRVIGNALCVIARRHRDDAVGLLGIGERQQFVQRAAFLVGGCELLIFELQPNLGAEEVQLNVRLGSKRVFMTAPRIAAAARTMSPYDTASGASLAGVSISVMFDGT